MYIDPWTVIAPQALLKNLRVLYNGGPQVPNPGPGQGWSLATGEYDGFEVTLFRWNGGVGITGFPNSRNHPTWTVLPEAIALLKALTNKTP